jgi:2'-5' RNA ligase
MAGTLAAFTAEAGTRLFAGARLRLVDAADLHLTLRFLGSVDDALVPSLIDGMQAIAKDADAVRGAASGLALWPSRRAPRVLVLGLRDNAALNVLAARCEALARALGLAAERLRFRPHITLARLPPHAAPFPGTLPQPPPLDFLADEVLLMQSLARPGRPRYGRLARAALRRSSSASR